MMAYKSPIIQTIQKYNDGYNLRTKFTTKFMISRIVGIVKCERFFILSVINEYIIWKSLNQLQMIPMR